VVLFAEGVHADIVGDDVEAAISVEVGEGEVADVVGVVQGDGPRVGEVPVAGARGVIDAVGLGVVATPGVDEVGATIAVDVDGVESTCFSVAIVDEVRGGHASPRGCGFLEAALLEQPEPSKGGAAAEEVWKAISVDVGPAEALRLSLLIDESVVGEGVGEGVVFDPTYTPSGVGYVGGVGESG
jgi:hypothetical protein